MPEVFLFCLFVDLYSVMAVVTVSRGGKETCSKEISRFCQHNFGNSTFSTFCRQKVENVRFLKFNILLQNLEISRFRNSSVTRRLGRALLLEEP